jgi:hypothetical protein
VNANTLSQPQFKEGKTQIYLAALEVNHGGCKPEAAASQIACSAAQHASMYENSVQIVLNNFPLFPLSP